MECSDLIHPCPNSLLTNQLMSVGSGAEHWGAQDDEAAGVQGWNEAGEAWLGSAREDWGGAASGARG